MDSIATRKSSPNLQLKTKTSKVLMNAVATRLNHIFYSPSFLNRLTQSYSFSMLGVKRDINESLRYDKSANDVQDERTRKEKLAINDESWKNPMYSVFQNTRFLPLYEVK